MPTSELDVRQLENVPPHSLEAERSVLSALLIDRDAADEVVDLLTAEDFYFPPHQVIYTAIKELAQTMRPTDLVTVVDRLRTSGQLERADGAAYVADLADFLPSAANVSYHAKLIEEKSILRRLIQASLEINRRCHETVTDVDTLVSDCEQLVFNVAKRRVGQEFAISSDVLHFALSKLEQRYKDGKQLTGVVTGFKDLDEMTSGLQPGELVVLAARPSIGKTSLAMNIACHAAIESREPVAVFSIEMSSVQLALRMICGYGRVNAHKLRTGHLDDDDWLRLSYGLNILSDAPIYFDDSADISVYQIRGKCRRLAKQRGLGMVVIDYLQLIRHQGKSDNRVQQISEIVAGVKSMARELNVPVIALSQLSREVEKREDKRPTLSDLRESGSIEAEADLVLLLYRPWSYGFQTCKRADGKYIPAIENGVEHIEVIVAKHRNGPTGSVYLKFEPEFTTFRSVDTFHLVEPE